MKEFSVLNITSEHATAEREGTKKDIMFTKLLLFQKCKNEINSKPEYQTIKDQLSIEKDADKRGTIIMDFIKDHYLRQLVNIEDFLNVRDIIYFDSSAEYLNQF